LRHEELCILLTKDAYSNKREREGRERERERGKAHLRNYKTER